MLWVQFTIFGLMTGAVYGLLSLGLVLTWRTSRVLNLSHTAVATAATYVFYALTTSGVPVGLAFPLSVTAGALMGGLAYQLVFRRVVDASVIVKILVAIGVSAAVTGAVEILGGASDLRVPTVMPSGSLSIVGAGMSYQQLLIFGFLLVGGAGTWWILYRTTFGLYVRAVSSNRDASRLAGIDDGRVALISWSLAGGLAAVAGILVIPINLLLTPLALAPFLVSSLAAAVAGGLVNPLLAVAGGLAIGVLENLAIGAGGTLRELGPMVAFLAIAGYLVLRWHWLESLSGSRLEARAALEPRAAAEPRERVALSARGTLVLAIPAAIFFLAVPLLGGFWSFVFTLFLLYVLMGQAIVFTTGMLDQISLMPAAFIGIGAFALWAFEHYFGYPHLMAIAAASLVTVPVSLAVAVPALRLRGPFLAVGTLAFASLLERTLFKWDWLSGGFSGVSVARPNFGLRLDDDRWFYYLVLGITALAVWFLRCVTRRKAGRAFRSVRDNEAAAQAMGINPVRWRLSGFVLSGCVAGLAGALLALTLKTYSAASFGFGLSLTLFGMTVLGGMRSIWGPLLGATGLVVINELLRGVTLLNAINLLLFGLAQIHIMLTSGDGLVGVTRNNLQIAAHRMGRVPWLSFAFTNSP